MAKKKITKKSPAFHYPKRYLISAAILLFVIICAITYFISTQKNSNSVGYNQASPIPSPTQTMSQQSGLIPNDWTFKQSKYCNIMLPIPPNEKPYVEFIDQNESDPLYRRFWQLREGEQEQGDFTKISTVMYVADIEASGHIEGTIRIQCRPKGTYTSANAPEIYLSTFDNKDIKLINKRTTKLWGKNVVAAKYKGGMFNNEETYFVIEDNQVYKIDKRSDSDKESVKNATNQIFNNLQFLD